MLESPLRRHTQCTHQNHAIAEASLERVQEFDDIGLILSREPDVERTVNWA
jgi:hypothetical protein